jgi:hypothetical protein
MLELKTTVVILGSDGGVVEKDMRCKIRLTDLVSALWP